MLQETDNDKQNIPRIIKVVSAKLLNNGKQLLLNLNVDDVDIVYFYSLDSKEDSEISSYIRGLLEDGSLVYESPSKDNLDDYMKSEIRSERNRLLEDTDKYLTIPDYPISDIEKEQLIKYRQGLRDLTDQRGFPNKVKWPVRPDFLV